MSDRPFPARPGVARRALLLVFCGLLAACQGRRSYFSDAPGPGGASPAPTPSGRGGVVSLSARDLAPVDAFIRAQNSQWILGDDVEIAASREYFAQQVSVTAAVGMVRREDSVTPDETRAVLTFIGSEAHASVERNPRVMIGTGITVSARRRLVLRLLRTKDPSNPVSLRIVASGDAVRGHKEEVQESAPELRMGGALRRSGGGWTWVPLR